MEEELESVSEDDNWNIIGCRHDLISFVLTNGVNPKSNCDFVPLPSSFRPFIAERDEQ